MLPSVDRPVRAEPWRGDRSAKYAKTPRPVPVRFVDGRWELAVGDKEVWDGSDLALLRDSHQKIAGENVKVVAIQMRGVKMPHTGFFGLTYDWAVDGWQVLLLDPTAEVQRFLWFRTFMEESAPRVFELHPEKSCVPE